MRQMNSPTALWLRNFASCESYENADIVLPRHDRSNYARMSEYQKDNTKESTDITKSWF
jgi:hypothetical protein